MRINTDNFFNLNIPSCPIDIYNWIPSRIVCKRVEWGIASVEDLEDYLQDYPTAMYLLVQRGNDISLGSYIDITLMYYDIENEQIRSLPLTSGHQYLNGIKLKIDYALAELYSSSQDVPVSYEQYVTLSSSITPSFTLTDCQVMQTPFPYQFSMDGDSYYNMPYDLTIRANDGYKFIEGSYSLLVGGLYLPVFDEFFDLSANGKLLSFKIPQRSDFPIPLAYFFNSISFTASCVQEQPIDINYELTNVTSSNTDTSIVFGGRYQSILSVASGYSITDVLITMDGVDITENVYNASTGAIDITSVIAVVYIHAVRIANPTITNTLTGCTSNNSATSITYGDRYQATITALANYTLEDARVLITMDGVELFDVYNELTGAIDIPSVTGNLSITIIATTIKSLVIKSVDGLTTFITIPFVRIRTILYSINQNTRTLRVNGTDYTWVQLIPEGKSIIGLSLDANSNRYIIPLGIEVSVNFHENITLYECMVDEVEPSDSLSLILYKQNAEINRVDKTNYLTLVNTIYGTLKAQSSILNATFTIEYDGVIDFNYVYIPIWNRYYFVSDIVYGIKNLITITLKVDVLMSHKDAIYLQEGLIARNEYTYNEDVIDAERIVYNDVEITNLPIDHTGFEFSHYDEYSIVANVIGG